MAVLFVWWVQSLCGTKSCFYGFYDQVREEGKASYTAKPKLPECLIVSYQCLRGNGMVQVVALQTLHPLHNFKRQNHEVQEEVMKFSLTSYEHPKIFFTVVQQLCSQISAKTGLNGRKSLSGIFCWSPSIVADGHLISKEWKLLSPPAGRWALTAF